MVKNLNQLKKSLKTGTRFQITNHCRPECVGQLREVTVSNTQGFYSIFRKNLTVRPAHVMVARAPFFGGARLRFGSLRMGYAAFTTVIQRARRIP